MKKSLAYINTNVEFGWKFYNNIKNIGFGI